jgi:hypothetical protein
MLATVHFREEHRLRCEKQVLRELLGRTEERERERERGSNRKLHYEELYVLYCSPGIKKVI